MKINPWTLGLAAAGVISLAADAAEETMSQVLTSLSATSLSGYIDTTTIWKFGTGNANMPGRVYDGADVQDGFNLNVVSLTLEKPLDEDAWSAGYHVQLLLGPGAQKRGTGLFAAQSTGVSESAFNEAYVALRVPVGNGIDFKVGQFGTYNGFEAYDTYKNPNWSRSYGFYIESSAHTGVSASYKVNDVVSVMGGVGNTASFSNQVDARSSSETIKSYLAMIQLTAPESVGLLGGSTLAAGYTSGVNHGTSSPRVHQFYVGGALPTPVEGLTLGLGLDYTANVLGALMQDGAHAKAAALYVLYQATEKLKLNNRFDYARGSNGSFGYVSTVDGRNELFSYTLTADYALWKNVLSRAEFRWDHALSGDSPFGGLAAGAGRDKDAVSIAMNLVYVF